MIKTNATHSGELNFESPQFVFVHDTCKDCGLEIVTSQSKRWESRYRLRRCAPCAATLWEQQSGEIGTAREERDAAPRNGGCVSQEDNEIAQALDVSEVH